VSARKLFIGLGVLAAVGIGVVVWIGGSLDSLVKAGVEKYGPRITRTEVALSSVKLDIRGGRGTLKGLRIANPAGFSRADAVAFGEITLDLDVSSLGKEPIVIEQIRVAGPELLLELAKDGATNLGTIRDAAEKYAPPQAGGIDGSLRSPDGPVPRIVVKRLEFDAGTIRLDASAVGGAKSERELGSFTLTDLGGSSGVPADRLGREILRTIVRRAVEESAGGELERVAKDKLKDAGGGLLRSLSD
jgi:hypothetical protein